MLELQRASAGSGKTYALAKKFIWYYITIPDERGRRRLRRKAELRDSLGHILAVTFTNKATNEMQQRIVEKLNNLAHPSADPSKKPDYMEDFRKELSVLAGRDVTEEEISKTCEEAVTFLLNNYSDFHVSTIDSFFQQVLRTFAYESDLSDSYRIELDTDHLSAMAIDGLLEDINAGRDQSGASFWIDELMDRAKGDGKKWNAFVKSAGDSPYALLTASVKRLENEEFKEIRQQLDEYFASGVDLQAIYKELKEKYELPLHKSYRQLIAIAKELKQTIDTHEARINPMDIKTFKGRVKKVGDTRLYQLLKDKEKEKVTDFTPEYKKTYLDRKRKGDTGAYEILEEIDRRLGAAYNEWASILTGREFKHWQVYRENFPFMGMLQAIRDKRDEYLRENNAIELGETNSMLHDIIGEDDAPFIYERIGTRLNHFLIDEFQDTSKMQWQNMSPLLHESIARGNENLIIGDAKQSIYRFRNADSSLISSRVAEEFGFRGGEAEASSAQNTNWRSHLHIVQFNNSFFSYLAPRLNRLAGAVADTSRRDFETDYRNVVQNPKKREDWGYVRVESRKEGDIPWKDHVLQSIPEIVKDAHSRGYDLRDIAILVDKNSQGEEVIAAITEYNAQQEDGKIIEYVSEQSLKLSSSAAVALVVSVLETISRGADPEVRSGEDRARKGVADWSQVACNFKFYALNNPELSTPDCLDRFFAEGSDNKAISDMLAKMQAVTLPALVEAIIARFFRSDEEKEEVTSEEEKKEEEGIEGGLGAMAEIRRRDAVFLAAFQDLVLEYCESHPSDIASFLDWWAEKSKSASISSPEEMDAVTVMTVHKSKGLEFPIVIVPFADASFKDDSKGKTEWRWEEPVTLAAEAGPLPPYVPVATTDTVVGTEHEHVLNEYYDLRKMDALNSIYVAFTRAAHELYIFSKPGGKTPESTAMSSLFADFFNNWNMDGGVAFMESSQIGMEDENGWSYGTKPPMKYRDEENDTEPSEQELKEETERKERERLTDYTAHSTPSVLIYTQEDEAESGDPDDMGPREEGNLYHEILANVERESDIPRAVRRLVIRGDISSTEGSMMGAFLTAKVARQEVNDWFTGNWKVLNERPLLCPDLKELIRPDRVMVSPEGHAVVVDYKFGEADGDHKNYTRQVYKYVQKLKDTGRFRSVKGYLWYVRHDRLELVAD